MIDRRFRKDVLVGYIAQAVSLGCSFLFMVLLTRSAGLIIFGAMVLLTAISGVLTNLVSFRTNEAVVAFCKQAETRGEPGRARLALTAGVTLDLAVGGVLFALMWWFAEPLSEHALSMPEARDEVRLYGLVMACMVIRGTAIGMWQSEGRFLAVGLATMFDQAGKLAVLAVYASSQAVTLRQAVVAVLVPCAAMSAVCCVVLLGRLFRMRAASFASLSQLREFLGFSANTFVSSTLKAGNQQIDTLVLGLAAGPATVGLYGVFRQFLSPLAFLSTPFTAISYPRFVQAISLRKPAAVSDAIRGIDRRLTKAYMALAVVLVPVLIAYLHWVNIAVLPSAWVAFALMMITAFTSGRLWWARPFSNSTSPSLSLKANLAASIALLALLWPAAHWLGLVGVAATMATVTAALSIWWRRQLDGHTRHA